MDNTTLQKTFPEMQESTIEKKIAKVRKIANQIYEIDKGETKERKVYKRIDDIITQEQLRKQVVADLLPRQEYWTQEAKDFAELKSIVNQSELQRIKASL